MWTVFFVCVIRLFSLLRHWEYFREKMLRRGVWIMVVVMGDG